jgi:hypothetical protein
MDVFEPRPDMICIEDIAHALSNLCRFGGHTQDFYSVADHCIRTQNHFKDPMDRMMALMHDASEAYLMDFPRPIKNEMPVYKQIEDRLMEAIAQRFNFNWPMTREVKEADEYMLHYEWENKVLKNTFTSLSPFDAKHLFMKYFIEIEKKLLQKVYRK